MERNRKPKDIYDAARDGDAALVHDHILAEPNFFEQRDWCSARLNFITLFPS
jgi:hypothetical protein